LSETLFAGLRHAEIEEAKELTDSDHKIVTAELWLEHAIANNSNAKIKRKEQTRTIYLYEEAKQED